MITVFHHGCMFHIKSMVTVNKYLYLILIGMEKSFILKLIRDNLYDYKVLLDEYDYYVFVETVVNEINRDIELNDNV